ncbi:MAG: hypothetical protein RLZZ232_921 [Planctomycetota bacterium]|jgi:hypothetical protein
MLTHSGQCAATRSPDGTSSAFPGHVWRFEAGSLSGDSVHFLIQKMFVKWRLGRIAARADEPWDVSDPGKLISYCFARGGNPMVARALMQFRGAN